MSGTVGLQIFLFIDVFIMGVLATIAVRHAYAHFRPHEQEPEDHATHRANQATPLPPAVREQMLEAARANFQKVLDHAAMELQRDLGASETRLTHKLDQLGSTIVGKEMERFHTELEQLRQHIEAVNQGADTELAKQQAELKAKLDEQLSSEKERLLQLMDTKLADAVASFLTETMQHNIDLGAQGPYLSRMLIEHTAELKRELTDEA